MKKKEIKLNASVDTVEKSSAFQVMITSKMLITNDSANAKGCLIVKSIGDKRANI